MVMGNAFSNCKGSSAFSSREEVNPIKVIIQNKEPIMGLEISLREEPNLYVSLAALY
jgi:hypothetical protein